MKAKIEELEEFERLVRQYYAPYYSADMLGYGRDYGFEKSIDDKVLYYLKLGMTVEDMKLKIAERDREDKERREKREREI